MADCFKADIILFLGSADGCPDLTLMEKNAMKWNPLAQKSLVILNDTKPVAVSGNTRLWQEVCEYKYRFLPT
jgi:hypothetical protein